MTEVPVPSQYFIANGVRRSVAAREAGLADILARLIQSGQADIILRVPLADLHSPKPTLPRDARYLRVEAVTAAGTDLDPIEIQPFGLRGQGSSVPLAAVLLL